jgi:O-antigen ligase
MKYLFFAAAILGILPMTVFLICDRRMIRLSVLGLILPQLAFDGTAINFFSHEAYRGTSRGLEVSLVYIMAAVLLLAFTILRGQRKLCPDWGSRIYILYFLLCVPSLLNAANILFGVFELWKMAMIHLVFMAAYYYLEFNDGDIDIIIYGLTAMVVVNFLDVLIQYVYGVYRARGVFPHPNSMAMYMEIAGILLFSRIFNNREGRLTVLFFFVFLMAAVAIVRTFSRGAIFCFPLGLVLTVLCSLWGGLSVGKTRWLLLLLPLALAGTIIFMPKIIDRFKKAPKASADTRRSLAVAAVRMIQDKPWIGVGINNWGIKINPPYPYGKHRRDNWSTWSNSDSIKDGIVETIYLLVGAECGLPCLFVLLCWFGYYWLSSIRLMKLLRRTRFFYIPAGTFGALTAVFMQSALEWVLKQQINFIFLVTVFAIVSFLNKHYEELIAMEEKAAAADAPVETPPPAPAKPPKLDDLPAV